MAHGAKRRGLVQRLVISGAMSEKGGSRVRDMGRGCGGSAELKEVLAIRAARGSNCCPIRVTRRGGGSGSASIESLRKATVRGAMSQNAKSAACWGMPEKFGQGAEGAACTYKGSIVSCEQRREGETVTTWGVGRWKAV